ncbi:oxidoreductase [Salinicola rhizosphaerae]|uniref:Short-chain dehydrogenase/reductase n=1 Tax=Salinicola rhizosphaerae TaxID=1443141 RepID=A0ABQ3DTW4_9GAMM|nr:oxidoreductase [Salinicola rhizosphaerae]GHB16343.1 short-chain dehydrogenase/reductase [Salinicola rhizosphaerae]
MSMPDSPVWFITGCSTGFGRELARLIIDQGGSVVVSARARERVADLVEGAEDRALALALDVTDPNQITAAVAAAEAKFGRLDVLVNNAGYGYQASVEEGEESAIRAQFDANVFGLFAMTRAVLPGMRQRRAGHIISISSVAGFIGFPGSGYYAASKHAVEGWSDSLKAEVEPLGIRVTCVEPGPFRTDWAGRSLQQTPSRIDDYAETAKARMAGTSEGSGKQPGDPRRAAQTMIDLVAHPEPPRHLVLGAWGVGKVTEHLEQTLEEVRAWGEVGAGTDYPDS